MALLSNAGDLRVIPHPDATVRTLVRCFLFASALSCAAQKAEQKPDNATPVAQTSADQRPSDGRVSPRAMLG